MTRTSRRKIVSSLFVGCCALSVLVALVPLAFILFFVITQGIQAINLDFFTHMPQPVGEAGGGMANSIVGTLLITGLGSVLAIPVGIISGVYMSEYAGSRFSSATRFAADTLNGVPSIVIGVFAYGIAVLPFRQFSALAGGIALVGLYAVLVPVFGFLLTTFLFIAAFMYLGRYRNHLAAWATSAAITVLIGVLFLRIAYVSLPRGVPPFDRITDVFFLIPGV